MSSANAITVLEQGDETVATPAVPAALIRIDGSTGEQTYISKGGLLSNAIGENPNGFAFDQNSQSYLVVDRAGKLVQVNPTDGSQTLLTTLGGDPSAIAVESPGRFLITDFGGYLLRFDSTSNSLSVVASGGLIGDVAPWAVQMHSSGDAIVSGLTAGGNDVVGPPSRVIRIDPVSGSQTLIAETAVGQFRDFALTDTDAYIAISSRGYAAGTDTVSKLDLATGQVTPVISGLQRALDVDFAPDHSLLILDQLLSLPCCPPWVPVVYSASQDGSMQRIVSQGGDMFAPGRLVVLP
jgi:hypothetical protein